MTANQIAYQELLEGQRANKAREVEVNRNNLVLEGIRQQEVDETKRANLAREIETNRSNLARELETARNNQAVLAETIRSNQANEQLQAQRNATEAKKVALGYAELSETKRSHTVNENIARYNAITNNTVSIGQLKQQTLANQQKAYADNTRNKISADANAIRRDELAARYAQIGVDAGLGLVRTLGSLLTR